MGSKHTSPLLQGEIFFYYTGNQSFPSYKVVSKPVLSFSVRYYLYLPRLFAIEKSLKIYSRTKAVSVSESFYKMCKNTRDPQRIISQYRLRPRWFLKNGWPSSFLGVAADSAKHHTHHHHYYFYFLEEYDPEATSSPLKQKVCSLYLTPCLARRLGRISLDHHNLACDWRLGANDPKVTVLL